MNKISRYFFLGLVAVTIASCGTNAPDTSADKTPVDSLSTGQKDTVTFTIEPVSEEFYCTQTAALAYCKTDYMADWRYDSINDLALLKAHAAVIKRNGNNLEVITKKEKQVFKNKIDRSGMSDDVEVYYVHAVSEKLVALKAFYYESYDYVCIDLETGQTFHTWGEPVPSPNGDLVIAGNTDLMAAFTNNGLQLYTRHEGQWTLSMEKMLDDWGPVSMFWLKEDEVISKKMSLTQTDSGEVYKTEYVKVILKQEKI